MPNQKRSTKKTAKRRRKRTGLLAWRVLSLSRWFIGALIAAVVGFVVWAELSGPGDGSALVVELPGEREAAVDALEQAGLLGSPRAFSLYLSLFRPGAKIEAGQHLLVTGLSPRKLISWVSRSAARPSVKVTVPEGWNQFQIARRLEEKGVCTASAFLVAAKTEALRREHGIRGPTLDGYLFPATYGLRRNGSPARVIARLVEELRDRLKAMEAVNGKSFERLRRERDWGEHEILTLASIIEKETANPKERSTIAGVFFNRLDDESFLPRARLQSDPTAGYGCLVLGTRVPSCGKYDKRKVTPEMLRDATNTYNTYRHAGLPPGPIANPGEAAIEAVLEPADTPYYYFVASRDGQHVFSRTLAEHEAAIDQAR